MNSSISEMPEQQCFALRGRVPTFISFPCRAKHSCARSSFKEFAALCKQFLYEDVGREMLRACAEINSHFAAFGPQPDGARRRTASASLPLLDDPQRHRLRRGASHLPPAARAKMGSYFCADP